MIIAVFRRQSTAVDDFVMKHHQIVNMAAIFSLEQQFNLQIGSETIAVNN